MARLLGDANPELAKRFGLDSYQREQLEKELEKVDHRVKLVTFQQPPPRDDGKDDPIAYLPPSFTTYGILDRDHRNRAAPGETWFVEVLERSGVFFLVPLAKFDVAQLGDFLPDLIEQVADHVGKRHPEALAEQLGGEQKEQLKEAKQRVADLEEKLEAAAEELSVRKARIESLEAELQEEQARSKSAPAPQPAARTGGHEGPTAPVATPGRSLAREGMAARETGDVLTSELFTHEAYAARFTLDLSQLHLVPDRRGEPCFEGSVEVPGLTRADPEAAPRQYPMRWDEEIRGFVVRIGSGVSPS